MRRLRAGELLLGSADRLLVLELTGRHPLSILNGLWMRFHGLTRPTRPTVDDAVAVLSEAGLCPSREDWTAPSLGRISFGERSQLIAWVRRRLCLRPERDPEIDVALSDLVVEDDGSFGLPRDSVVTLWWDGTAG